MAYYNPFRPSYKIGDIVDYALDGTNFGCGCCYIDRIVGITYPIDGFGVYEYILHSTMPNAKPVKVHPSQVKKKYCEHCNCKFTCPHINR